jgi:ribonuclease HII
MMRLDRLIQTGADGLVDLPHFDRERLLIARGLRHVAGIDEVGRGPLAGPVTAAAVILDPADLPEAVDDSKALSAEKREILFELILAKALAVGIGFASPQEIDRINIRQATFAAMRRAVVALSLRPHHVLIDGNDFPKSLGLSGETIIKGDAICLSIAAASIVAKVARDRLMVRLDAHHPAYGFAQHKGYATPAHRAAIQQHGPSVAHRMSFSPCRPE